MSHDKLPRENPDDLKQVQEALAALAPRPPAVNRDRLMFLAGAAATGGRESGVGSREAAVPVGRKAWLWPAATAALGATSLVLAIALMVQADAPPRIVYVERPAPEAREMGPDAVAGAAQDSPTAAVANADEPRPTPRIAAALTADRAQVPQVPADNYLRSREVALRMGLDALGSPRLGGGSASAMTYLDWLAEQRGGASPPPASPLDARPQM
jgi:hypothetical protein